MKWKVYGSIYAAALTVVLSLNSCVDDPITPNNPGGNQVDTTWVDSTNNSGGGGTPSDSTNNGGNNGGGNTSDSTWIDSTWNGGTNPFDSIP